MEEWKVFQDDQGKELFAYTIREESEGEEQATRQELAYRYNLDPVKITTCIEHRETLLNGPYYHFESMDADITGFYPVSQFTGDRQAILKAAEYEATLYRKELKEGKVIASTVLYDPSEF